MTATLHDLYVAACTFSRGHVRHPQYRPCGACDNCVRFAHLVSAGPPSHADWTPGYQPRSGAAAELDAGQHLTCYVVASDGDNATEVRAVLLKHAPPVGRNGFDFGVGTVRLVTERQGASVTAGTLPDSVIILSIGPVSDALYARVSRLHPKPPPESLAFVERVDDILVKAGLRSPQPPEAP